MVYLPHWPTPSSFGGAQINHETVFLRMSEILLSLGNPHQKLPPVIHLAGTNGKGSTAAFLAEILRQNGLKINLYTSPHIHNCNERININGAPIDDNYLYEILEEVRHSALQTPITFFETFTIAAILAFSKSNCDICIFESGMGARIDATNIVAEKLASIITPISLDHCEFLGDNIAKIAFEKSFIIKPKTPVIIAPQPKEAMQILELIAKDQNAKMIRFGDEFNISIKQKSFDFKSQNHDLKNLNQPCLDGLHQYINAATAIACALELKDFSITKDAINNGLAKTSWPNRLEKIDNLLEKNHEVYIDSAHNPQGAKALSKWLSKKNQDKINYIIVGFSKGKCSQDFLLNFKDIATEIITINSSEPQPESAQRIYEIAKNCGLNSVKKDDLFDALHYLSQKKSDVRVVICGSIHLGRDVKKLKI